MRSVILLLFNPLYFILDLFRQFCGEKGFMKAMLSKICSQLFLMLACATPGTVEESSDYQEFL